MLFDAVKKRANSINNNKLIIKGNGSVNTSQLLFKMLIRLFKTVTVYSRHLTILQLYSSYSFAAFYKN